MGNLYGLYCIPHSLYPVSSYSIMYNCTCHYCKSVCKGYHNASSHFPLKQNPSSWPINGCCLNTQNISHEKLTPNSFTVYLPACCIIQGPAAKDMCYQQVSIVSESQLNYEVLWFCGLVFMHAFSASMLTLHIILIGLHS